MQILGIASNRRNSEHRHQTSHSEANRKFRGTHKKLSVTKQRCNYRRNSNKIGQDKEEKR